MRGMQSGEEANCEVCEVAMRKAQRAVGPQFACVLMIAPLVETQFITGKGIDSG